MKIDWTNVGCLWFGGEDGDSEVYALMGFDWSAVLGRREDGVWQLEVMKRGEPNFTVPFVSPDTLYQIVDELNNETLTD